MQNTLVNAKHLHASLKIRGEHTVFKRTGKGNKISLSEIRTTINIKRNSTSIRASSHFKIRLLSVPEEIN